MILKEFLFLRVGEYQGLNALHRRRDVRSPVKPAGEEIQDKTDRDAEKSDSSLKTQSLTVLAKWMPIVDNMLITNDRETLVHVLHSRRETLSAAGRNVDKSRVIPAPETAPSNPVRFSLVINKG